MNLMKSTKDRLARQGEKAVRELLEKKGYQILETNYRTRYGEIDIIAAKDKILVFVEVKTRTSTKCGLPEEAVNYSKQRKLRSLAVAFLSVPGHKHYFDFRFDVASVIADSEGIIQNVNIIEGAF